MIKVKKDLTNMQFGRLTVLEQAEDYITPQGVHKTQWLCECSCEEHNRVIVLGNSLTRKHKPTRSCGCLRRETTSENFKKYNRYDISGEFGIGWTYNTNKEFYFELKDFDIIKNICWREQIGKYGFSQLIGYNPDSGKHILMHILLGYQGYDHIDHNELNNLICNLRPSTQQENCMNKSLSHNNTSGVIGVHWNKSNKKWHARLKKNGKYMLSELFDNKDDAIRERLRAEIKYFGEFAPQNHLFEQYGLTIQNDYIKED